VPADWNKHGRSAGFRRNLEMAEMQPDVVLACPGGRGTANMVEIARSKGLRVVMLEKMPLGMKRAPVAERPSMVVIDV
jgi:hypothetical protein